MGNKDLTFRQLRRANLKRLPLFKSRSGAVAHSKPDGSDWNLMQWACAVAGEVGEACNMAKKIERGDFATAADRVKAMREFAKELADVVIYADIAAYQVGEFLDEVVEEKFNEVSVRIGEPWLKIRGNGCDWCDIGNSPMQSSVSDAMVHQTSVGRVVCKAVSEFPTQPCS